MIISFKDKTPTIHSSTFLAEGTQLIGDINIQENCSIWFNAVLRADVGSIHIGQSTNIQDGTVIHVGDKDNVTIGANVTVGHNTTIHGAAIGDCTLIGMGSTILDGAHIGKNCLIGAGSLVTPGTVIGDGMLVFGSPAKPIKPLTREQIDNLQASADHYVELAKTYMAECKNK